MKKKIQKHVKIPKGFFKDVNFKVDVPKCICDDCLITPMPTKDKAMWEEFEHLWFQSFDRDGETDMLAYEKLKDFIKTVIQRAVEDCEIEKIKALELKEKLVKERILKGLEKMCYACICDKNPSIRSVSLEDVVSKIKEK